MSAISDKGPRVLACAVCQARKVKCDRKSPCSNCLKADMTCIPSTPAPRKKRTQNHDLQQRLAKCEELLSKYASAAETNALGKVQSKYDLESSIGRLVLDDSGSAKYTDNVLFAGIYDEIQGMKQVIDDGIFSDDLNSVPETSPSEEDSSIFLADSPLSIPGDYRPQPAHAIRLWQIFLDRVNPLTKIIHVPTVQPMLVEATANPEAVPKNNEALLFSIYLIAVLSMNDTECQSALACSKKAAMRQFSKGTRAALTSINILKTRDLVALQALTLYLITLCVRDQDDSAWVLNGVILRIAQKMGLHKDGELLGLPPFETEMRRRVWWQIIIFEVYSAVVSGVDRPTIPGNWHIREPANVNDADLFPGLSSVQAKEGPTDMIFCLFNIMVRQLFSKLPRLDSLLMQNINEYGNAPHAALENALRLLDEFERAIEELLAKYGDPSAGPVHDFCFKLAPFFLKKLREMMNPPRPEELPENPTFKDHLFRISVLMTERKVGICQACLPTNNFLWFARLQFHPDMLTYMAGRLAMYPPGPLVERAWNVLEQTYNFLDDLFDLTIKANANLAAHVLQAWQARQKLLVGYKGDVRSKPSYIQTLEVLLPSVVPKPQASTTNNPLNPIVPIEAIDVSRVLDGQQGWNDIYGFLDSGTNDANLSLLYGDQVDLDLYNWG